MVEMKNQAELMLLSKNDGDELEKLKSSKDEIKHRR